MKCKVCYRNPRTSHCACTVITIVNSQAQISFVISCWFISFLVCKICFICLCNVARATKKQWIVFYLKRTSTALAPSTFLALYKVFIRPHLSYIIQASRFFAHSFENIRRIVAKFVKQSCSLRGTSLLAATF